MAVKWHDVMVGNYYDPHVQLAWAAEWLAELASATCEARRALCLRQAERCLELVQRSMCTPVLIESAHARLASLSRPPTRVAACMVLPASDNSTRGSVQGVLANGSEMTRERELTQATGRSIAPVLAGFVPRGT
jgi:hypothetical protein